MSAGLGEGLAEPPEREVAVAGGECLEAHDAGVAGQVQGAVDGAGYEMVLGAVAPTRAEERAVQSLLDYRCEALILGLTAAA